MTLFSYEAGIQRGPEHNNYEFVAADFKRKHFVAIEVPVVKSEVLY